MERGKLEVPVKQRTVHESITAAALKDRPMCDPMRWEKP
jgi:hypothetical protein